MASCDAQARRNIKAIAVPATWRWYALSISLKIKLLCSYSIELNVQHINWHYFSKRNLSVAAVKGGSSVFTFIEMTMSISPHVANPLFPFLLSTPFFMSTIYLVFLTAGLDVQYESTKNIFSANQRSYDKSETTDEKLSARRIQIYWVFFSYHFWPHFLKQVKAWPQQKYNQQIWIRFIEYSSSKVSDPSEVPRFVFKLFFS